MHAEKNLPLAKKLPHYSFHARSHTAGTSSEKGNLGVLVDGTLNTNLPWRQSNTIWTCSWASSSVWPCLRRGLDEMTYRGPCQPQPFCGSVISVLVSCTIQSWLCEGKWKIQTCAFKYTNSLIFHVAFYSSIIIYEIRKTTCSLNVLETKLSKWKCSIW